MSQSRLPSGHHHTTHLDQARDGAQTGKVIIGRHYAATASSASTLPKDSRTPKRDVIPDYAENWHGDGDYQSHTGSETDWQHTNDQTTLILPTNSARSMTTSIWTEMPSSSPICRAVLPLLTHRSTACCLKASSYSRLGLLSLSQS